MNLNVCEISLHIVIMFKKKNNIITTLVELLKNISKFDKNLVLVI